MLLFSTVLDIEKTLTKDLFIKLVLEWNQGSPHESNVIKGINWNGERNIKYGDEKLWIDIEEYRNKNIIAVRYEKIEDDGAVWDTDYVMNFEDMKMSIRLDRSYLEEALIIDPKFSTPHFITLLIERGYVKKDGILEVLRKPLFIDNNNLQILSDIINGKATYRLPIVYISKTYYDENPVNVNLLAGKLKGVAHVLVQESNCTNNRLKIMCNENNEYYGAIGIYFPRQSRERVIFFGFNKGYLRKDALNALMQQKIPVEYDPYPQKTHGDGRSNIVTCSDAFVDLEEPQNTSDLSQKKYSKAKYMGAHCQGQTEVKLDSISPTIRSEHHGNIEYRRLSIEHGGNYDKQDNISDTTKYEDHFVAENRLIAISKSGRSMDSEDVQNFLNATERGIDVQLFVRKNKDDKISKEFYYLGRVIATGNAKQFVMPNTDKTAVEIEWELETPVREDIYQYIVNE